MTIVYDGDGNRVSETAGGITTQYLLVDDQNLTGFPEVVAESSSDASTPAFVYGVARISQRQFIPSSNSSVTSFYIYDGHGSVRALANPVGVITDTYDYDAFGNLIHRTGTTVNNFLFAGEQFDPALGVCYNRARYYDERIGRFWTMDTFDGSSTDPKSFHKYLYTGANPANSRDPSGNFEAIEVGAVLGIDAVLVSITVGFIAGGILGCAKGALTKGGSCAQGAASGAVYGGVLGAAGPFLTIPGRILLGLAGSWMAGKEAHDACEHEEWALCAFDALLAVGGVFLTGRSINEGPPPPAQITIGNRGGVAGGVTAGIGAGCGHAECHWLHRQMRGVRLTF